MNASLITCQPSECINNQYVNDLYDINCANKQSISVLIFDSKPGDLGNFRQYQIIHKPTKSPSNLPQASFEGAGGLSPPKEKEKRKKKEKKEKKRKKKERKKERREL